MQNKKFEFTTLKACPVHKTKSASVTALLVELDGIPHVGLSRTYWPQVDSPFESQKKETKGIYLPLEAWNNFLNEAVPQLQEEIQKRQLNPKEEDSTKQTSQHQQQEQRVEKKQIPSLLSTNFPPPKKLRPTEGKTKIMFH